MSDLLMRLRRWTHAVDAAPASELMDEAADEIERLRSLSCPYVPGTVTNYCTLTPFTLTDAEREAVLDAALAYESDPDEWECAKIAATLRGLLERTK